MKKLYIVLGVAAVTFMNVACNKENSPADQKSEIITIRATMPDDDTATKISLDLGTKAVNWEEGDVIKVISANNWKFTNFTLSEGANTKTASFTGTRDFGEATKMSAWYGPGFAASGTPGTASCYVQCTWSATQDYASGPKSYLHFMSGYPILLTNMGNLNFRALDCIVKIPVKGAGVTLSSIRLECDNKSLAGRFYGCTCQNGTYPNYNFGGMSSFGPTYDNEKGYPNYVNYVTLTDINEPLTADVKYFYIVVANPQKGFNHGKLTVTLTPTAGAPVVKTFSNFTADYGKIYKFPEVDMTE